MGIENAEQQAEKERVLRAAIRNALNGDAIIFLGAGASKAAKTSKGIDLPTGQELANALAAECGVDAGYSLDNITEHFIEVRSETALINVLRKNLGVASISGDLISMASVPWFRIWTTNYDDAFEQALGQHKIQHYSLTTAGDVRNAQGNRLVVLHINGAIKNLKQSITPDFILTSESYATQSFLDSEWSVVFHNDIQRAKAIIFIGYSLTDIDVARIIFNPDIYRSKIHFIDRLKINPVLNSKLSKFGTVHPIGLEAFGQIIEDEKSSWIRPDFIEEYQCFSRLIIEGEATTPSDDDFYDLVLRGEVQDKLILTQAENPDEARYTVVRDCEEPCIKTLGQLSKIAVVIGGFANGKSIAIKSISLQLASQGRDVFVLEHANELAHAELQRLCRREKDFVLVIENYSRNLALVDSFSRYARPDCGLLLSERTEVHELRLSALIDKTKANREILVYEVDHLSNTEITRVSDLLDLRGLWGERAGLTEKQRQAYLKHDCDGQMHAVLLDVANSPQIKKRLNEIVHSFESVEGGIRALITLCLLQVIGEQPRIYIAAELLQLSADAFKKLTNNDVTRQILSVQSGVAQFRSPIMAASVLREIVNATAITEVISECVKYAIRGRNADSYFEIIAKELMRFANLERILPDKGKRAALQNLFEDLKNVPSIRDNPQFWLQYAMARLSLGELDVARRYFQQSYSQAENIPGYDTFQIDNHYCRLLLLEAESTTDSDKAFVSVNDALTILKKQVQRENRHYPYRSVWHLEGVTKRHKASWTPEQRTSIVAAARYLVDAAQRLDDRTARSVAVVGGLQRLHAVISELTPSQ